jgi:hypothetical protein
MRKSIVALILATILLTNCQTDPDRKYELRADGMVVQIDGSGMISRLDFTNKNQSRDVRITTQLADCQKSGKVRIRQTGNELIFRQEWVSSSTGNTCLVTDRFSPGTSGIQWETEVTGAGGPWSTPIETRLVYPDSSETRFWTAWGDPRLGKIKSYSDGSGNWSDPLIPMPFVNDTIWYGAPPFRYLNPRIGFCPFQGNLTGIPLLTLSEEKQDLGVSLILSPEDTLLDLHLRIRSDGDFVFARENHRISSARTLHFHQELIVHESGWRGGLRWMTARYPGYFNPNLAGADSIAGTGAYSSLETAFDKAKMDRMAFGVNWKASFDFPYMGMFIPPVTSDTATWPRYGGGFTSVKAMRDYAAGMRRQGYHVLSYFNVTEFGANITDPKPARKAADDRDLWKNADDFLYYRLNEAILHVPSAVPKEKLSFYPLSRPEGPYFTWGNGIIMDPGEPVYQEYLLDQARRHIEMIPDAEGICIDRMDWLRMYNEQRDDSISWFGGQPTRSLLLSWQSLLRQLGPLMHKADKVIFVNNHDKRIDLLKEVDGFFDEFTYAGSPLNLTALMGVRRPVLGWTSEEKDLRPDPDAFFQRYLHMGVFPTAPFPGNDHSLLPGEWVDRQYLDYGPMLRLLKGKKWVLEPNCVTADGGVAKVNLFETPRGWVVPVTFGPGEGTISVTIRGITGGNGMAAEVVYPGTEKAVSLPVILSGNDVKLEVPLHRGCAMVRIFRKL